MNRVVITGMGIVAPNGIGVDAFDSAIKRGKSGIRFIKEFQDLNLACQIAGRPEVSEYKKSALPEELSYKLQASNVIFGTLAGIEAWKNADLEVCENVDWDSGVIMGMQMCDSTFFKSVADRVYSNNLRRLSGRTVEQIITSSISAYLSGYIGLGNCAISNSSACATGTEAIVMAYTRIKHGQSKRILTGSSEGNSTLLLAALDRVKVLNSSSNDAPEEACRPMSAHAKGLVPGCGAAALVLENLDSALERKATIYAEIVGGATNCGGQRSGGTMTRPNPEGMSRCIKQAIHSANIAPKKIDLISGHLTATYADSVEIRVWSEILNRNREDFPFINSLKSMTGHCFGAAGSIESVAVILQLYNNYIHPSINCHEPHPNILKFLTSTKIPSRCIKKELQYAVKASFGFGDLNSCIVFKKWKNDKE